MEMNILGLEAAMNFTPTKPTYAIRIDSAIVPFAGLELQPSGLYTIVQYVFDDIDPHKRSGRGRLFDTPIATELLEDFAARGRHHEELLIHCMAGKNRSPAVGMALNAIFGLGYDAGKLQEQFPEPTWHVYNVLMKTAREMKLP